MVDVIVSMFDGLVAFSNVAFIMFFIVWPDVVCCARYVLFRFVVSFVCVILLLVNCIGVVLCCLVFVIT